jgi:hypothetical protein
VPRPRRRDGRDDGPRGPGGVRRRARRALRQEDRRPQRLQDEAGARSGDVLSAAEDGAPACSAVMEEGRWAAQRAFSGESAALGFAEPSPAEPMTDGRRRALERRAERIVSETVERHGLKRGWRQVGRRRRRPPLTPRLCSSSRPSYMGRALK